MILAVLVIYIALVLVIGLWSHKLFRGTGEDFFVATRTIGPFILLMSLFGTNMTAFALLGASGEAYTRGIGVFALMASSSALVIPCVFYFVGTRLWSFGKRYGYVTQAQFFRERWGSDAVGLLLFVVLTALLVPYVLIGMMAGGITVSQVTGGQIPEWAGNLVICVVVLVYVIYGGMRGTAWVNTFQTLVFMIFGAATLAVVVHKLGGLDAALARVAQRSPSLLVSAGSIGKLELLSYMCIPLSAGMFPHLFIHWMTAQKAAYFRYTISLYPVCIAFVWVPSVLLGILAAADFPGLAPAAANSVILKMITLYAPGFMTGLLAAGVFSTCMNSLDSQVLSLGTMFTHDVVRHYGFHDRMSQTQELLIGQLFVSIVLAISFGLSLVTTRSIFKLGIWSFTGFAALLPIAVAALFWKRSTKWGAIASVVTVGVLWTYFFFDAGNDPNYSVGGTGLMPVAVILALSTAAMLIGSLLTRPPETAVLRRFFVSE
ncbi:MAG TPA: sodium:solute symporter family protein [Candidatus Polarisedimenticolia bacterium]|nr:sodium:solute symporter family protein [Candidatus Polarisedimenticolia bacterium]